MLTKHVLHARSGLALRVCHLWQGSPPPMGPGQFLPTSQRKGRGRTEKTAHVPKVAARTQTEAGSPHQKPPTGPARPPAPCVPPASSEERHMGQRGEAFPAGA